ncbi:transcriptional regulator, LacI family [Aliiroseovarius halocynthiae]|uniref:LacI family transcriptional regulator n=1 Tax=Aliiroseovarius halocynthiae TaxID=985055 RepID=A0A545SVT1_9RHOB|nr:LacI family DNA-binding transcriptional regulator [Aliiroseovarius halocynthiae]TQV69075.1 LacI family transcriptional regulator [Aliiroseovarius halocynthiae]SMR71830.1 transcriptional regulator, LacI family [Aliiroseovarius halocynthiae]
MASTPKSKPATAEDVAELAGVSRWTVNRAFKKDASISKRTLDRVMKAAARLDYAPDLLAASLASDRSNLVSLLIDDFANPHKLVMLEALTRVLGAHGLDVLLVNTASQKDTQDALRTARQRRVDAAVLIGSQLSDDLIAQAKGTDHIGKLIVFARLSSEVQAVSICVDDRSAMAVMTDHVLSGGYSRPLFLAGPQTRSAHLLRQQTFVEGWQSATGFRPEDHVVGSYDPRQAYRQVTSFLKGCPEDSWPDVIVCENDALAVGTIDALRHEFGRNVPGDLAVTGFDDTPQAADQSYQLTTYRQPISAMAEALAQVVLGQRDEVGLDRFTGELVIRRSA